MLAEPEILTESERRLVEQAVSVPGDGAGPRPVVQQRLRNLIAKYRDELKRCRLAERSGLATGDRATIEAKLALFERALAAARR
ncbi:MAG: hypothetical protein RQ847_02645 [Wenzhouxiangellaceae bacterium]|nr:hypothetical protein [Wenzhouxiangellaceae bacterium]